MGVNDKESLRFAQLKVPECRHYANDDDPCRRRENGFKKLRHKKKLTSNMHVEAAKESACVLRTSRKKVFFCVCVCVWKRIDSL